MQAPSRLFHSIIIIGAAMGTGCAGNDSSPSDAQTDAADTTDSEAGVVVGDVSVGEIDSGYDDTPMPWW